MCRRRLKIIAWLVACSFSWCWHSTLSADFYISSEKRRSTGRDGGADGSRDRQVPEFMMKLYKSVETGDDQLPVGNTVRSMAGQFSTFVNSFSKLPADRLDDGQSTLGRGVDANK